MTPKERAAMRQALDFIDYFVFNGDNAAKTKSISTALREALEQLNCQCGDKCFPVFSGDIEYCETCGKPTA